MIKEFGHLTAFFCEMVLIVARGTDGVSLVTVTAAACSGLFASAWLARLWRTSQQADRSTFVIS